MNLICMGIKVELDRIAPIRNIKMYNKPHGGLWACPILRGEPFKSDWEMWCLSERFNTDKLNMYTLLKTKKGTRVLRVNTPADVDKLIKKYIITDKENDISYIDFEKIAKSYDVLRVTRKAQRMDFMNFSSVMLRFYGWDVDTALILNKECIEPESITYHKRRRRGKYEKTR